MAAVTGDQRVAGARRVRPGRNALIEQLVADGVRYLFGNPGTVEQGFLDAMGAYDLTYVLALQETIAVAMADGYARATRRPAVVQLHSGVGLGNGIGMMYQAMRGHSPLVVINGHAGLRYDAMDAQMAADLVAMAEPVTKWATMVVDPGSVLRVLRRAMKIAGTPPMGPVFVALPMDVLDAPNDEEAVPTSYPSTVAAPPGAALARVADLLAVAERPMIVAGDGVTAAGAQAELTRVAELLGAEVWGADWSEVNMDMSHPLFQGLLGHMFGEQSSAVTRRADAILVCGTYLFPEVFPALSDVFAPGARVVHVDLDAYEIAKNFPVDIGLVSDPKSTLAGLADALEQRMDGEHRASAGERSRQLAAARSHTLQRQREADRQRNGSRPLRAADFAAELARQLPADAIIFDEAITTSPELSRYLVPVQPGEWFLTRGGSLGVGLPGAIGLQLANPGRVVVAFAGDGGSMYTFQALWTAVRHDVPAKFVICNNRSYDLLKYNLEEYWDERHVQAHDFPTSFDLATPPIDFVGLAESLGVRAVRVDQPAQVHDAIQTALAHPGPFLIDLVIAGLEEGAGTTSGPAE